MIGTLINTGAVIIGSLIGLYLRSSLPKNIVDTVLQAIGLFTLCLGIFMVMQGSNFLLIILSLAIGSLLGELMQLDNKLTALAATCKRTLKIKNKQFTEAVVTAFLLFCVGSMTLLGTIEEGIHGTFTLLATKSLMDGITSVLLAASLGIGVLFSAAALLIFQTSLTMLAKLLQPIFSDVVIVQLTAVGGVLIVGLGITLLEIKDINITNMLPSLVVVVIISALVPT